MGPGADRDLLIFLLRSPGSVSPEVVADQTQPPVCGFLRGLK